MRPTRIWQMRATKSGAPYLDFEMWALRAAARTVFYW
jgi:hypothetical protein